MEDQYKISNQLRKRGNRYINYDKLELIAKLD